jgi:hypothetical protein
LLVEIVTDAGKRYDIQLKGSGRTPFSRSGDGKSWLGTCDLKASFDIVNKNSAIPYGE